MRKIKSQYQQVANGGEPVELLKIKVMEVIEAQWSQELRNISSRVQANQQTPSNEPNIGYATQLQQDIMDIGIIISL